MGYRVYFTVYPAADTPPTRTEVIEQTYAGGINWIDNNWPLETTLLWEAGGPDGLTPGTDYRIAGAVYTQIPTDTTVTYSDTFTTPNLSTNVTLPYFNEGDEFYPVTVAAPTFYTLEVTAGLSYSTTFNDVGLLYHRVLSASDPLTYIITFGDTVIARYYTLDVTSGLSYTTTFNDVELTRTYAIITTALEYDINLGLTYVSFTGNPEQTPANKYRYVPVQPTAGVDPVVASWIGHELNKVSEVTQQDNLLQMVYAPPERPVDGLHALADGKVWNPGHGQGEYVFFGEAWHPVATALVYWDDERSPAATTKRGSLDKPDYDYTNMGYLFPQNDTDEILYIQNQLPHSTKTGNIVIYPHVHYLQDEADSPTFKIDYRFYNNGVAVPPFTTASTDDGNGAVFAYTSGTILQILQFAPIVVYDVNPSMWYDIKLYRDDNLVSGDVCMKSFDFHRPIDTPGSRTEYTK